ncbi:unnamed protein product, partial [Prorocentrum cordatum]
AAWRPPRRLPPPRPRARAKPPPRRRRCSRLLPVCRRGCRLRRCPASARTGERRSCRSPRSCAARRRVSTRRLPAPGVASWT